MNNKIDFQTQVKQIMASGLNARGVERHTKERDVIESLLMQVFSDAKTLRFIKRTELLSFEQFDDVSNDMDMEDEGMDAEREWAEYQEFNY